MVITFVKIENHENLKKLSILKFRATHLSTHFLLIFEVASVFRTSRLLISFFLRSLLEFVDEVDFLIVIRVIIAISVFP